MWHLFPALACDRTRQRTGRRGSHARLALLTAGLFGLVGCGVPQDQPAPIVARAASRAAAAPISREVGARPRIVVLGDSLTAGLGLMEGEAYPSLLQRKLNEAAYEIEVVNAGVSGDTTAGGLRRLDWSLDGDVRILIVALGGNDGLRGLPVTEIKANLSAIVKRAQHRSIEVLLVGIEAPPNFGPGYTSQFRQVFRDVARERGVRLVPFLLQGVAGIPELNQRDGIHPTAEGARIMANTIWMALEPLLGPTRTS